MVCYSYSYRLVQGLLQRLGLLDDNDSMIVDRGRSVSVSRLEELSMSIK